MSATVTDRELLELSAKAAGVKLDYRHGSDAFYYDDIDTGREEWNPLGDDRQAFRLSVKLNICTLFPLTQEKHGTVGAGLVGCFRPASFELYRPDRYASMRRAIVRAAAEIGRGLASQPDTEKRS